MLSARCENSERRLTVREIHVHVPAGLSHDQVIHIHLDDAPPHQPVGLDTIEAMLLRLEASPSASPKLRDTVAELKKVGYELRLPERHKGTGPREKYLRIMDPALTAHGAGYVRPGSLILTRQADRDVLAQMPGAIVTGSGVRFVIDGHCEVNAARRVKGSGVQAAG
jgi:hypothetical protein